MATNVIETRRVSATPTVDTSAYASGDVIGGIMTFAKALRFGSRSGRVVGLHLLDKTASSGLAASSLWLFSSSPSASTTTDQGAFNLADADLAKVCGVITLESGDVVDGGTGNQLLQQVGIYVPVFADPPTDDSDPSLYGVLVAGGAVTFAAASDFTARLTIECD